MSKPKNLLVKLHPHEQSPARFKPEIVSFDSKERLDNLPQEEERTVPTNPLRLEKKTYQERAERDRAVDHSEPARFGIPKSKKAGEDE